MGKSISYCYKCSSLLREDDFAKGKAFQDGDRVVCARCAPELRDASRVRSSSKVAKVQVQTRRIPIARESGRPAGAFRRGVVLAWVGGALGALLLAGVLLSGRKESSAPLRGPEKPEPIAPAPSPPPVAPRPAPEEALLLATRAYAAAHPEDLAGQVREYEKLVLGEFERTPAAREARKEIDAVKARILVRVQAAQAALELELEEPLKRDDFGGAVRKISEAGGRLAEPEWALALSKRTSDVYDQARRRGEVLARTVESLGAQGKAQEIREIVDRVRSWQIPREIERIEEAAGAALAARPEAPGAPLAGARALPIESKPRTAEGKAYLARWETAMAKVAARDYPGALEDLARSAASLKEPDVVAESRSDLDDVKRLQALVQGALAEAVAKPAAWMRLELRDDRTVAGRVLDVDPERVAIASRETAFAEWSEVKAASIAALGWKAKPDARLQALLCLSEGELEAAKALLGPGLEAAPAKYWAWAPGARSKIPKAEGLELAARDLLYAAEREYASVKTRGPATDKYRSLRKEYLSTSVVRRSLGRIERRSDACREYAFAASDLGRSGTLKLTKAGKLESDADSDENNGNRNWAEIEFYALPGAAYRAWVQVGGCCQPVMTFYWQATELTVPSPKTRKPASADVGTNLASEVRASGRGLKSTHDPKTPKAPTRWEWVELPLPKYAEPGPKRLRLMTDQKGFAVAQMVVSASRKVAPKEDEQKEIDRLREPESPAARIDPDLVAWFPLDDGGGSVAQDRAGSHPGTVQGTVAWVAGMLGGAFDFDGQTYLNAGDSEELRLAGDITIAFWMSKKAPGGDWQRIVGKGDERLRCYGCWTGGEGDTVLFQQYSDAGQQVINIKTQRTVQIGAWNHFAATVQGNQALLYLDGVRCGDGIRTGTPAKTSEPLLLGWGTIHNKFKGSLQDVRIYRRGLSPEEIEALARMGR